ncbi:MAG: FkbM family methyltransferase, partial [Verrucomicrobia bacterium]|nr:FkbM family methyltransferase [Verrucomicrobiota bacterium]
GLDSLQTVRTEVVETERLDKLLAGVSIVDFLKLDIQGFELQALRGAESVLDRTNVIHCEVEFAPMYAGVALFSEIELHLRQRGFELVDLVHEARSPYCAGSGTATADQLIWGDAVFFKSKQNVKSATNYLSQALLAWLVYGKRSLAAYLLEHYDDIAGTKLAMSLA